MQGVSTTATITRRKELTMEVRNINPSNQQDDSKCPFCEGPVVIEIHQTSIPYGLGECPEEIPVELPVLSCKKCGIDYVNHVGEDLEKEAICRHFGLLTPIELKQIRTSYRMSLSEFSKMTGIEEDSIIRWENGERLQSKAIDRYLRTLSRNEGLQLLQSIVTDEAITLGKVAS